jgi:serine/threonine protein kinase
VARALDAGVADDVPWMLLEGLEGEDLAALVARKGALDHDTVRAILVQIGQGLGGERVHGGLRPELVFVEPGNPPFVKLLGYGVARYTVWEAPPTSSVVHDRTPLLRWLSPEQATGRGAAPTAADDVFALGLLGFFMLTGKPYWKEENLQDLVREIIVDPLPSPTERARELGVDTPLPPGFDDWLLRCLSRVPADRFASAEEAAGAFFGEDRPWEGMIKSNPTGSLYDDGLSRHADEMEREREATDTDGTTGYRRTTRRPPWTEGQLDNIRANPKGSFYDGGFRNPRRWPVLIVLSLLVGGLVFWLRHR